MSPVAQDDVAVDAHAADMGSQDSPLSRKISEPMHQSITQSQSPASSTEDAQCAWCGIYIDSSSDDELSQSQLLKEHIASVHPHIAKFAMYEGGASEEPEDDNLNEAGDHPEDMAAEPEDGAEEDVEDEVAGVDPENAEVVAPEIDADSDKIGATAEPEVEAETQEAESDQLPGFSHERDAVSVDNRLHDFWNLHDPREFSQNFDDETAEVEDTWNHVYRQPDSKKRGVSDFSERPGPYKKDKVEKGQFLEVTPFDEILTQLRDPESRSTDELFAITQNAALVLKTWQDEYMAIDKLYKRATRFTYKPTPNPRKPENPDVFKDQKEAALYGYKYDPKADKVGRQDPFVQGGFRPNPTQMRRIINKSGPGNPNPDGWRPIRKFGADYVPKLQDPPRKAPTATKATRKRKAAEIEAATMEEETEEGSTDAVTADDENPPKRRTRGRAAHNTDNGPPTPSRNATRGRGRGRGASRMLPRTEPIAPAEPPPPPMPVQPVPALASSLPPAENEAENGEPAALGDNNDEVTRRQKIANSRNPKRTEAMLNHWARFNREGRIRNPKRTKAQIEADRAVEAARRTDDGPRSAGRRRRTPSIPPFTQPPAVQPAPMPLAARGSIAPYAPMDARLVSHPYGPGPQYPPPQFHGQQFPGQMPGQPLPAQHPSQHPGQHHSHPSQHPGQHHSHPSQHPGQLPGQQLPGQHFPGQPLPGHRHPGPQFPGQQMHQQQMQQPPHMPYHSPYTEYYMHPYSAPAHNLPQTQRRA